MTAEEPPDAIAIVIAVLSGYMLGIATTFGLMAVVS